MDAFLEKFCKAFILNIYHKIQWKTPALETLLKESLQGRFYSVNLLKVYRSATL